MGKGVIHEVERLVILSISSSPSLHHISSPDDSHPAYLFSSANPHAILAY